MYIDNSLMAVVISHNGLYLVRLGNVVVGTFGVLLDAHCFAMQLMERGIVQSVRLYSGTTVT